MPPRTQTGNVLVNGKADVKGALECEKLIIGGVELTKSELEELLALIR